MITLQARREDVVPRLDHITIPVRDWQRSRDWYVRHFGFEVEFEIPAQKTAALRDEADLTLFVEQKANFAADPGLAFTIQVADVDKTHEALAARGIAFVHPPQKVFWGYGAELLDPDGYRLRLWDPKSMKERGGG
jgi:catechol 2,3-dioxygenase-like lactoylglutathione lyase family enzyme